MLIHFPASFNIIFEKGGILNPKTRIHALDEIRGFCVFCMVFDHALFTYGFIFANTFARNLFDFFSHISPAFAAVFVLLCGISCRLSRSNLLRGLRICAAALVLTFGSLIIMPHTPIIFGILHLLGLCVLLYHFTGRFTDKLPAPVGIAICALLFALTYNIGNGYLGIGNLRINIPFEVYESNHLMVLGIISPFKAYSDYFPLLPWIFAFYAGVFIGKYAKEGKFPKWMYKSRVPFLQTLGKNAFFVYLIHQPLGFGVFYIISLIGGNSI